MVYYIETNLIAIVIGIILLIQGEKISSKNETSHIIMTRMLQFMILLSTSDIFAYCFRGENYWGVEISNTIYFLTMALGTYAWFLYIVVKTEYAFNMRKLFWIVGIPIFLLCIAILFNPLTGFFFSVDENCFYHRGSGVLLTWVVEWSYIFAALGLNIRAMLHEKRIYRKRELRGYLLFAVPIAVSAVCQMLFYGMTTTQVGYMIAVLMAFINKQHYQVQRDELTGLNNKNAFLKYQDAIEERSNPAELTVFMIDVNHFKMINDRYGHLKGDQALKDVAEALKNSGSALVQHRTILFRYGGDEFVIIGTGLNEEDIAALQSAIWAELRNINQLNRNNGEKYTLSVSIGCASGKCGTIQEFSELLKKADQAMYRVKHGHV